MAARTATVVTGVIGADVHSVGNTIVTQALASRGFKVVNLGVMVSQSEFISAAIESDARALFISSLYGHAELDCQGLRNNCEEAGLTEIVIFIGGNIVVGKCSWNETEKKFIDMGFDRAYPPGASLERALDDLQSMLAVS